MTTTHVLKHRPSDFIVREVLVPRTCTPDQASYEYYSLAKSGFTTMEAIGIIASAFELPSKDVTYGGLKDEDGLTEQLIAMPASSARGPMWEQGGGDAYLRLVRHGYGEQALRIGGLEGNAFRIIARSVDPVLAAQLCDRRTVSLLFFNYYDIQRFGVPGGVRRTHLVGRALLEGDWDTALVELVSPGAPESKAAREWTGGAKEFFQQLDPRVPGFYLSSHGSHEWNKSLRTLVRESATDPFDCTVEGIDFTYGATAEDIHPVLAVAPRLDYRRYSFEAGGEVSWHESSRASVIQTQVAFDGWHDDDSHEGKAALEMRFFLPSGCYATAALRQLFSRRDLWIEPATQ